MNLRWADCCDTCKNARPDGLFYHLKCVKLDYNVNMSQICDYYEEVDE